MQLRWLLEQSRAERCLGADADADADDDHGPIPKRGLGWVGCALSDRSLDEHGCAARQGKRISDMTTGLGLSELEIRSLGEGIGAEWMGTRLESAILVCKSGKYLELPPGRLPRSAVSSSRHSCGPSLSSLDTIGTQDMTSTSAQPMSKIFSTYAKVRLVPAHTSQDLHTKPRPCTSKDCFENPFRAITKCWATSTGYPNVMDGSTDVDDRQPLEMESCHTTVRNHCCEILKSTIWFSVTLR